jgi:hypothetical protein
MPPADSPVRIASTTGPSPEYRRHFHVDEPEINATRFQPAWRVKTHLAALAERGHIGRAELEAGLAWRRWCETLGRQRTQSWVMRVDGSRDGVDMTENELAAATRLRAAAQALGPDRAALLCALILDDCRWPVICAVAGVKDPKTAKDRCAEALAALAARLAGKRVPDPPRRSRGRPPRKYTRPPAPAAA